MSSFFIRVWLNFLSYILKFIHFAYSGYECFGLGCLLLKRKCKELLHVSDFNSQLFVSEFASKLKKCPSHFVVIVGNDGISFNDFSNLVLWCLAAKISFVSFYDYSGYLKANEHIYYNYLIEKKKVDPKSLVFDFKKLNTKNGFIQKIHLNIVSLQDCKPLLVELTQNLSQDVCSKRLTVTEINENLINSELYRLSGVPEPDLCVISGKIFGTYGFLPWHIRVTEFQQVKSLSGIEVSEFASILSVYSSCTQRFGK